MKQEKVYSIRAYCSKCHKLLMESVKLTKRELLVNWDEAVMKAPNIKCEDCNHDIPNFYLDLKIYHSARDKEYDPKKVLPTPDPLKILPR